MLALLQSVLTFVVARLGTFLILAALLVVCAALYLAGRHYFQDADRRAGEVAELLDLREVRAEELREEIRRATLAMEQPLRELGSKWEAGKKSLSDTQNHLRELEEQRKKMQRLWLRMKALFSVEAQTQLRAADEEKTATEKDLKEQQAALAKLEQERAALSAARDGDSSRLQVELDSVNADIVRWREEHARLTEVADARKRTVDALLFWLNKGWDAAAPAVFLLAFALFVVPSLAKIFFYYAWAPLLQKADPVHLSAMVPATRPVTGPSAPALEMIIPPGQRVLLHHDFYQASDAGLVKKTRFLFDWRYPLTSLACRLSELTEVRNAGELPGRITVSNQTDPTSEVALVEIPAGASLVIRPRQLAAIHLPSEDPARIRARWRLRNLHAWITLQFRYFEFEGPCALVLRGQRGVRAESVDSGSGNTRVTNQTATIGFTPSLKYHSRRAETFWSYFRGRNPLFDDAFSGDGVFLCQQISKEEGFRPARFWKGIGDVFLKAFGI